jgi:hypothetical protein
MTALLGAFALQGALIVWDEFYFHRKRGLGLWERIGHPLDTLTILAPLLIAALSSPEATGMRALYIGLSVFSCLFVTKDEWVHAREAPAAEHWLHALLFMVHPVVLALVYQVWSSAALPLLWGQVGMMVVFWLYQLGAGLGMPGLRYATRR